MSHPVQGVSARTLQEFFEISTDSCDKVRRDLTPKFHSSNIGPLTNNAVKEEHQNSSHSAT